MAADIRMKETKKGEEGAFGHAVCDEEKLRKRNKVRSLSSRFKSKKYVACFYTYSHSWMKKRRITVDEKLVPTGGYSSRRPRSLRYPHRDAWRTEQARHKHGRRLSTKRSTSVPS